MTRVSRSIVFNIALITMLIFVTLASARPFVVRAPPSMQAMEVSITLTGTGIDAPDQIPDGLVTFVYNNMSGAPGQGITIVRLKSGKTIEDLRAALPQGFGAAAQLFDASGGLVAAPPGVPTPFTLTMKPGSHVLIGNPQSGHLKAMEVTAASGPATPEPRADVAVTLKDFQIVMPDQLAAGMHTMKVTNAGPSPHHLIYAKLLPGKKAADILAGGPNTPPPVDMMTLGGIQALDNGQLGWVPANLQPGSYVAVCFIHDPATNKSHAELGMLREFTVPGAAPPALPNTGEAATPVELPNTGSERGSPLLVSTALLLLIGGIVVRRRRYT